MPLPDGTLLVDSVLRGMSWCRAQTDLVDEWLAKLYAGADGSDRDVALVALGGYGRRELCPSSDLDLMLLTRPDADVAELADRIWYPIWDAGVKLGHSVRSLDDALGLGAEDLDTATALLDARCLAGDADLTAELRTRATHHWRQHARQWLDQMGARVEERQRQHGEVAYLLEPDLKEGRGGLRDVHSLRWAELARLSLHPRDQARLDEAGELLLAARVELQRLTGRPSNVLLVQEQDGVAAALGRPDANAFMIELSRAAQAVAWTSDETWRQIRADRSGPTRRLTDRRRHLGGGLWLHDGSVGVDLDVATPGRVPMALTVAMAAASRSMMIDRDSLEIMAATAENPPEPWNTETRACFVSLLGLGAPAIPVVESLDQIGIWTTLLPEWDQVRSLHQRNVYHRYTVDRHLLQAVANASALVDRVERPDLLILSALLHDLGKGGEGDHSRTGAELARTIGRRMGFGPEDVETLATVVANHLLLPEVATRRDIDDPTTISNICDALASPEQVRLLAALTEADSLATGPAAWGRWKADLVQRLTARVIDAFAGLEPVGDPLHFPTPEQLERLHAGDRVIERDGSTILVMDRDRPGNLCQIAGALALHGLDVLDAAAYSNAGRALSRFEVTWPEARTIHWDQVCADLRRALDRRIALSAGLAERARTYQRRRATGTPIETTVRFDDTASNEATVIDVSGPDSIGALYRLTRAFIELGLDIRTAKVQSSAGMLNDSFYVLDESGATVDDPVLRTEIERAIVDSIGGSDR